MSSSWLMSLKVVPDKGLGRAVLSMWERVFCKRYAFLTSSQWRLLQNVGDYRKLSCSLRLLWQTSQQQHSADTSKKQIIITLFRSKCNNDRDSKPHFTDCWTVGTHYSILTASLWSRRFLTRVCCSSHLRKWRSNHRLGSYIRNQQDTFSHLRQNENWRKIEYIKQDVRHRLPSLKSNKWHVLARTRHAQLSTNERSSLTSVRALLDLMMPYARCL